MAIALDTSSKGTAGTASWSHTCTGLNLVLIVSVYDNNSNTTGVTYNGVAMTQITSKQDAGFSTVYMFYLINPATGSNTITISKTSGTAYIGTAGSYTGCAAIQPDSFASSASASSPMTSPTTVVLANCWLVGASTENSTVSASPTTNRTDRQTGLFGSFFALTHSDSNGTVGTGSQSFVVSKNGGTLVGLANIIISLSPFIPAPAQAAFLYHLI